MTSRSSSSRFAGFARAAVFCASALSLSSCAELASVLGPQGGAQQRALAPTIQVDPPQLRRYPNINQLAAYYCPMLIDNFAVRLTCAAVLGAPPPPQALSFEVGVTVKAKNPNNIPIPMLDVLLGLTLFPGQDAEGLGAICVSMCGSNEPSCNGAPRPGACTSGQSDIRRIEDFAARVPGLIAGLATGQVQEELRKSTIVAGGDLSVDLSFALGIEQALRIIQKTAKRFVEQNLQGQRTGLEIPIAAQGSVFVNLPVVGRLGVGYGPLQTTWKIQ